MNLRRISFLVTPVACSLFFAFPAGGPARAADNDDEFVVGGVDFSTDSAPVIGHLQEDPPAKNATVNGQPAGAGAVVHQGDLVETGANEIVIHLHSGQCVEVFAHTSGRIYDGDDETSFVTSRGGFRLLHPNNPRPTPPRNPDIGLPYTPGFNGGFSGTSIGGGGGGSPGPTTTRVVPGLGIGLFDFFGTFIRFL